MSSEADARSILESRSRAGTRSGVQNRRRAVFDPARSGNDEELRIRVAPDRDAAARHADGCLCASCGRLRRCRPAPRSTRRARRSAPVTEYALPDGGTRLSFPRGKDTYMLDFDASGHLVQSQQVLNLADLRHDPAGDAAGRGADAPGPAGVRLPGRLPEAAGLNYRFGGLEGDCMVFQVSISNATGNVTEAGTGPDPRCSGRRQGQRLGRAARARRVCFQPVAAAARGLQAARSCLSTNGRMPPCL